MTTMPTTGEGRSFLEVTQPRERRGCDACHTNPPTEQFVGFCGNQIWICHECLGRMIDWKEAAPEEPR